MPDAPERWRTARHEARHTVMAYCCNGFEVLRVAVSPHGVTGYCEYVQPDVIDALHNDAHVWGHSAAVRTFLAQQKS